MDKRSQKKWTGLVDRIITSGETCILHETPETRTSGSEWRPRGSRQPERPKSPNNGKKVMASVFWDSEAIIIIDFLPPGGTVNGQYYLSLLSKLRQKIKDKRRQKEIILHDNATCHKCSAVTEFLDKNGWIPLKHPP